HRTRNRHGERPGHRSSGQGRAAGRAGRWRRVRAGKGTVSRNAGTYFPGRRRNMDPVDRADRKSRASGQGSGNALGTADQGRRRHAARNGCAISSAVAGTACSRSWLRQGGQPGETVQHVPLAATGRTAPFLDLPGFFMSQSLVPYVVLVWFVVFL